ncbi:Ribosome biogenesis protein NSA1 [Frankliniella fusca]|uniref:Ribosome biogenesis protein NSA1 n=1 Tax=Frankliniella fusca TaxID=407009 RepID=A0AAE1HV46_9NEOP|nr:Ribosome biogenesis protein NSA1 [Frankliniella fusca]KAK3928007.1 Ribosome biogenesis protein NSA1 [Frankliniella fusca]
MAPTLQYMIFFSFFLFLVVVLFITCYVVFVGKPQFAFRFLSALDLSQLRTRAVSLCSWPIFLLSFTTLQSSIWAGIASSEMKLDTCKRLHCTENNSRSLSYKSDEW